MAKKILLQKSDEMEKQEEISKLGKMEIVISFNDNVISMSRELPEKVFDALFSKLYKYFKDEQETSFTFEKMGIEAMECSDETSKRLNLEE